MAATNACMCASVSRWEEYVHALKIAARERGLREPQEGEKVRSGKTSAAIGAGKEGGRGQRGAGYGRETLTRRGPLAAHAADPSRLSSHHDASSRREAVFGNGRWADSEDEDEYLVQLISIARRRKAEQDKRRSAIGGANSRFVEACKNKVRLIPRL